MMTHSDFATLSDPFEFVNDVTKQGNRSRCFVRNSVAPVSLPQSVIDSANRETYVNTVRGVQKTVKPQG